MVRVETFNAGLHRRKAVLRFRDDSSRGAIFTEEGESSIEVISLDEVLAGDPVSFRRAFRRAVFLATVLRPPGVLVS